jgi:hypothetical protein
MLLRAMSRADLTIDGRVIDETPEAATDDLKPQDAAQRPRADCASSIRDPPY